MSETKLKLQIVLIVLSIVCKSLLAIDDSHVRRFSAVTVTKLSGTALKSVPPATDTYTSSTSNTGSTAQTGSMANTGSTAQTGSTANTGSMANTRTTAITANTGSTANTESAIQTESILSDDYIDSSSVLFSVTRPPRYFGVLQDHRGQPLSVEVSEEYMDQDYIATNRKRHKLNWNRNPLDIEDFDDDETEEIFEDKDKDVKVPNMQAGPV